MNKETITIQTTEAVTAGLLPLLTQMGITMDDFLNAFCSYTLRHRELLEIMADAIYSSKLMAAIKGAPPVSELKRITSEEFLADAEAVFSLLEKDGLPIVITAGDAEQCILAPLNSNKKGDKDEESTD